MSWPKNLRAFRRCDVDLAPFTYYRIGGRARDFFSPTSDQDVADLLHHLNNAARPWRVLGGGANTLIDDGLHETAIIQLGALDSLVKEDELLLVGAGYPFLKLVGDTVRSGRQGLEGLAGIPGQMGGICAMNAGGRWGEIKDVVVWLEIATAAGTIERVSNADCGFGYRSAKLSGIVTRAALRLPKAADPQALRRTLSSCLKSKSASQPLQMPSSGCIFANPEGGSAGRLVESMGLKGRRVGDAEISLLHGNFIVNHGTATFADVLQLIELVEQTALERHGIVLRREIQIWQEDESAASDGVSTA